MTIIQALTTKPIDWAKVEAVIRTYPTWVSAVDEYAKATQGAIPDELTIATRGKALRRALAWAVVEGKPASSISTAARLCASLKKSPVAMLNAYFSGDATPEAPATEGAKFRRLPQEQLVEKQAAVPEPFRNKTILPALPVSGQWWKRGESTFVLLEIVEPIGPKAMTKWFERYLEEVK